GPTAVDPPIIAKRDAPARTDIKQRAHINAGAATHLHAHRRFAAIKIEDVRRRQMSALVVNHVVGNGSVVPIPVESARLAHLQTSPITCAGLPMTRTRPGTPRRPIAPGSAQPHAPPRRPSRL